MIKKLVDSKSEMGQTVQRIIDNFKSDDVIIINKDSYKFKRYTK